MINTPRSIQACSREGLLPKDLLYRPPEYFEKICNDPKISKMHYRFFEAKRKGKFNNHRFYQSSLELEKITNWI